ncbi:MAG TPA: antibiotic biosynthesis monooxygenase [Rubrivivax sp.]|nr:antibiotic biosynthesis monooxygenase [Rubrivivax sp.]
MSDPATNPVTVMITRRVRPGLEPQFQSLMSRMQTAAAAFPGHMGGFLIPPQRSEDGCWHMLHAFDTQAHQQAWSESPERRQLLQQVAEVTHGDDAMRVLSGLETWFALPAARTKAPPPRWKMALVTWAGIFPLVWLMSHTLTPLLGRALPPLPTTLLVTGAITLAMTWLVMPVLVRLLAFWLYPIGAD